MLDSGKKEGIITNYYGDENVKILFDRQIVGENDWLIRVQVNDKIVFTEERTMKGFGRIRVYVKKLYKKFKATAVAVVKLGFQKAKVIAFDYWDAYKKWYENRMNYRILQAWDGYGYPIDLGVKS